MIYFLLVWLSIYWYFLYWYESEVNKGNKEPLKWKEAVVVFLFSPALLVMIPTYIFLEIKNKIKEDK